MYLLSATIFGFLNASFSLPMRLFQIGYQGTDSTIYSNILCKIIWFLLYSIRYFFVFI